MPAPNGYGTVSGQNAQGTRADAENAPLLGGVHNNGKSKSTSTSLTRFREYMLDDIDKRWADLILLASYIITGLLDSSATFIWGSFVSMQTGNTVYLGQGVVYPHQGTRWIRSGTSVAFFCFGSFCFARYHRYFSPKRRWVLVTSIVFQLLLIVGAAVIVVVDNGEGGETRWEVLVPISLVAFQSGGQAVISRALQYNALTSVVLTSIYCDLFSDPLLMAGLTKNAERNRRAAAPLLLLVGAMFGGLWAHSSVGLAGALWTAAIIKVAIIIAFFLWKAVPRQRASGSA